MNEYERQRQEYAKTPAGAWREAFGITEVRDLAARDAFIAEVRSRKEDAYKRPLYPEEETALQFAAEQRTTTARPAIPVPQTSWEIAERLRWGVEAPPKPDLRPLPMPGAR